MKIMILSNDTTYVYKLRREIIEKLIEKGNQVYICSEIILFSNELLALGCKLIDISVGRHGTNPLKDVKLLRKYRTLLKEHKPDVVLSYNIKPNVYGGMACGKLRIPFFPNVTGLGTAVENKSPIQFIAMFLYKLGVKNAECIFFQNEENHQFFIEHGLIGKKSRINVLPGSGVNLIEYPILPYPQNDTIDFLFVARILKEKGIDYYLSAARKFHADKVKFHICGMCDDEDYIRIIKEEQDNNVVIYHGQQLDMRPFFEMCSCVVHPSYYPEGMSNVLLEAAASGRPVITADRSGCREIVENDISGFVIPIKDESATVVAVEKFLSLTWEERYHMGIEGRKKIEREFSRDIVVNEYMKELSGIHP